MTDELNARGLGAITRPERVRAYDKLHLPPYATLSRATVIKIGEIVGASEVLVGERSRSTATRCRSTCTADSDRRRPRSAAEVEERGALDELFAVFERVARAARARRGDRRPAPVPPPLEAFEQLRQGTARRAARDAGEFLETALTLHPGYDRARLALWEVRTGQGDHAAALAAARAVSATRRSARRAQFLAGVSLLDLKRYDEAFDGVQGLLADCRRPGRTGRVPPRRSTTTSASCRSAPGRTARRAERRRTIPHQGGRRGPRRPGPAVQPRLRLRRSITTPRAPSTGCAKRCGGPRRRRRALRACRRALSCRGNAVEAAASASSPGQLSSHYEELDERPPPTGRAAARP